MTTKDPIQVEWPQKGPCGHCGQFALLIEYQESHLCADCFEREVVYLALRDKILNLD